MLCLGYDKPTPVLMRHWSLCCVVDLSAHNILLWSCGGWVSVSCCPALGRSEKGGTSELWIFTNGGGTFRYFRACENSTGVLSDTTILFSMSKHGPNCKSYIWRSAKIVTEQNKVAHALAQHATKNMTECIL